MSEFVRTVRRPARLRALMDRGVLINLYHDLRAPGIWVIHGTTRSRVYRTYDEYRRHQRSKQPLILRTDYDERFRAALRQRLISDGLVKRGAVVLCLGARSGAEVRAFLDYGCFAVGVDIKPTRENPWVLAGDFQALQFPDATVDAIFTNSLDHAHDIDRVLAEIARVLKPDGLVVVEAVRGSDEAHPPGPWESFYWATIDELVAVLVPRLGTLVARYPIEVPWPGEHLVFARDPHRAGESHAP